MHPLLPAIQTYLAELLGTQEVRPRRYLAAGLPLYVLNAFDLVQLPLFGENVVLAIDKVAGSLTPHDIATRINKIRTKADLVLYVTQELTNADRGRLIQYKVPFLVPGTQLYLPDLGINLREHFRRRAALTPHVRWSPSTQALLFSHLLALLHGEAHVEGGAWHVATTTLKLAYTPMTGSRAANEIISAGLGEMERRGRSAFLRFHAETAQGIWADAKPFVTSPVHRTVWVNAVDEDLRQVARVAGGTALARYTLLHEPDHEVLAVRREDWTAKPDRFTLARPEPGAVEIQLWRYSPSIEASSPTVDPLSLFSSLRADPDERVQIALQELEEPFNG